MIKQEIQRISKKILNENVTYSDEYKKLQKLCLSECEEYGDFMLKEFEEFFEMKILLNERIESVMGDIGNFKPGALVPIASNLPSVEVTAQGLAGVDKLINNNPALAGITGITPSGTNMFLNFLEGIPFIGGVVKKIRIFIMALTQMAKAGNLDYGSILTTAAQFAIPIVIIGAIFRFLFKKFKGKYKKQDYATAIKQKQAAQKGR